MVWLMCVMVWLKLYVCDGVGMCVMVWRMCVMVWLMCVMVCTSLVPSSLFGFPTREGKSLVHIDCTCSGFASISPGILG